MEGHLGASLKELHSQHRHKSREGGPASLKLLVWVCTVEPGDISFHAESSFIYWITSTSDTLNVWIMVVELLD